MSKAHWFAICNIIFASLPLAVLGIDLSRLYGHMAPISKRSGKFISHSFSFLHYAMPVLDKKLIFLRYSLGIYSLFRSKIQNCWLYLLVHCIDEHIWCRTDEGYRKLKPCGWKERINMWWEICWIHVALISEFNCWISRAHLFNSTYC